LAASPDRGVMIVLAYLWPFAFIPLLLEKRDAEVRWHAKHGILLMIAEMIAAFAFIVVITFASVAAFGFGCALGLILIFGFVGILGLHIAAMLKGINGARLRVPGISDFADRF
jgi:uncharacterized membrane protein